MDFQESVTDDKRRQEEEEARRKAEEERLAREEEERLDSGCRKITNISRTISHNLDYSRLVLQLSLPNHWSQMLGWEWRCSWSSADRRCSNYIWVINNFIAYQGHEGVAYIRMFTVLIQTLVIYSPLRALSQIIPSESKYYTYDSLVMIMDAIHMCTFSREIPKDCWVARA